MIEGLLPAGACAAEAYGDHLLVPLFPGEQAQVAHSTALRYQEYATVRGCARTALARLGHAPGPLVRGPGGAPQWPHGVVGSLTHCPGYRSAVVARATDVRTLGIDAEPAMPLPDGVLGLVATEAERAHVSALASSGPEVPWDRLLFCAKEAAYKAWYPLTGRWLNFRAATVRLDPGGTFTAAPHQPEPGEPVLFAGRWRTGRGLLLAAAMLPEEITTGENPEDAAPRLGSAAPFRRVRGARG